MHDAIQDVDRAQSDWGSALVQIGRAPNWDAAHALATREVRRLYVQDGSLLFCPTKAAEQQFRRTLTEAVSYFVGRDPSHPEDQGFALQPWTGVRFENAGIVQKGGVLLAMGNYFFQSGDGAELKVEFTFGYVRDETGRLVIQLHHSALPYRPDAVTG